MKSRLLLYAFVIVVIGVFIGWIARNTYWDEMTVPMPLRGEAVRNPFYSSQRLAESLGARTQWRKTLGDLPPVDAVMMLDQWDWGLIPQRREQIEKWVEAGGRLVVNASFMADREDGFTHWSGVSDAILDEKAAADAASSAGEDGDGREPDRGSSRLSSARTNFARGAAMNPCDT
jgi:hypothetical protein